jgi:hypothetical protein
MLVFNTLKEVNGMSNTNLPVVELSNQFVLDMKQALDVCTSSDEVYEELATAEQRFSVVSDKMHKVTHLLSNVASYISYCSIGRTRDAYNSVVFWVRDRLYEAFDLMEETNNTLYSKYVEVNGSMRPNTFRKYCTLSEKTYAADVLREGTIKRALDFLEARESVITDDELAKHVGSVDLQNLANFINASVQLIDDIECGNVAKYRDYIDAIECGNAAEYRDYNDAGFHIIKNLCSLMPRETKSGECSIFTEGDLIELIEISKGAYELSEE